MERNAGYEIKRLLLYDDNKGFALGENLRAPDPYVTSKVTEEQGRRSFDWWHYFTTERVAVKDFLKRAADYEKDNSVSLVSEGPQPDSFKYYSTQRPIDIGTFPKGGGNDPIRFQNYDKRLPVEGGAFLAWGELEYGKQLTEDEMFCYELRPSRDNPDVWRRMDALAQAMTKKRRRPIHLHVMVLEEEQALIRERMVEAGIRNMGAYMRKMALNGYVLHVDLSPVRELVSLQRRCSNNLNQVAIQANTYGGIYPEEIKSLQRDYEKLWGHCPIF